MKDETRGERLPTSAVSRERIRRVALDLIERHGDFTLSQIASELGVRTPSLYSHVSSREDVVSMIRTDLLDEMAVVVDPQEAWAPALKRIARTQRDQLARYPAFIDDIARAPARDDSTITTLDNLAQMLLNAGFAPQQAVMIIGLIDLIVIGGSLDATSPVDMYPGPVLIPGSAIARVVASNGGHERNPDDLFEFSLEVLVTGLASLLSNPIHRS